MSLPEKVNAMTPELAPVDDRATRVQSIVSDGTRRDRGTGVAIWQCARKCPEGERVALVV